VPLENLETSEWTGVIVPNENSVKSMADVIAPSETQSLTSFENLIRAWGTKFADPRVCEATPVQRQISRGHCRGAPISTVDSSLSGDPSFVTVVQSTYLGHRHHWPHCCGLNGSWLRCVLPQREVGS
jgi:hypothetical protein